MFQFKKYISFLGLSACLFGLSACSNNDGPGIPDMSESDMVTVNFCLPQSGPTFSVGSTRAGQNIEGDVSNLYIVAVQTTFFNYLPVGDQTTGDNIKEDPAGKKYIEQPMTGNVKSRVIVIPLNVYDFNGTLGHDNYYKLTLYPGHYRFYAVANCDLYTGGVYNATGSYTEEKILEAVMSFDANTPLRLSHLPMSCVPEKMKYYKTGETNPTGTTSSSDSKYNYTIPIYKNPYDIEANLEFLCTKVRYTILFDATQPSSYRDEVTGETVVVEEGISVGFGNQSIRFNVDESTETNPYVTNIRERAGVFYEKSEDLINKIPDLGKEVYNLIKTGDDIASWNLTFSRYEWPESGKDYPKNVSDELTLWDASLGLDEWKSRRKRAWQGVVYLPANDDIGKAERTKLVFPYIIDWYKEASEDGETYIDGVFNPENIKTIEMFGTNGNENHYYVDSSSDDRYSNQDSNYDIRHGLVRGKFYDIVARVVNPDVWDLKIIVYAKLEEWHDVEQDVTESGGIIKDDTDRDNGTNTQTLNTEPKNWLPNSSSNQW